MIGQPGAFGRRACKLVTFADLGEDPGKLLAPTLAARGCILFMQKTLAGDRHRLGNGGVERLGQPPGGFLGAGISDRNHIEAYICLPT